MAATNTDTVDAIRAAQLRWLSERIRARHAEVRALELERTTVVHRALADGWTHARIAEATGLTRGRINQLAHPTGGLGAS